jgi:hypothetical protein
LVENRIGFLVFIDCGAKGSAIGLEWVRCA